MKVTNKYLFYITYRQGVKASAASKPVIDTSKTLQKLGYKDCSLTFENDNKNLRFYFTVLSSFASFFFRIKSNSIVATQFPITTVNYLFIYFIKFSRFRRIKFITIIHDLNTLRQQGTEDEVKKEIKILSAYDGIVAHNKVMEQWLFNNGLPKKVKTVPLNFFDYLASFKGLPLRNNVLPYNEVAFAGHLTKASFIYSLESIKKWRFNIYGEHFDIKRNKNNNTYWKGEFSPDEIIYHLQGSFGLVWDGLDPENIHNNNFGNYIRYNNPFKFSLYIAAGLPVIVPKTAAIASIVEDYNIGLTVNSLQQLDEIEIANEQYDEMLKNVSTIQKKIIKGDFLCKAVTKLEELVKVSDT